MSREGVNQRAYYEFMGYPAEVLRDRYVPYADRFEAGSRVLDIGCGRGEFLELLRERGAQGIGVDADPSMVEATRAKGLEATSEDTLDLLAGSRDRFDGIFLAHVAEHLTPQQLEALLRAAAGALRVGGRLIVVTPNPTNLQMHLHDFWIDLQHVRFYSPPIMEFLFELARLTDREVGTNDRYALRPPELSGGLPPLAGRPPEDIGRRRRALGGDIPSSVWGRISQLEDRIDQLTTWALSLYPPGEYYVTGVRSAGSDS